MPTIGVTINLSIECEDDSPLAREIIHQNAIACLQENEDGLLAGLSAASIPDYEITTWVEVDQP